jgi:hypothetical protein
MPVGYWSSFWYSCTYYALSVGWTRVSDSSTRGAVHFAPVHSTQITELAAFKFYIHETGSCKTILFVREPSGVTSGATCYITVQSDSRVRLAFAANCFINGNIDLLFSSTDITNYLTSAIRIVQQRSRRYCSVTAQSYFRECVWCFHVLQSKTSSTPFYVVIEEE